MALPKDLLEAKLWLSRKLLAAGAKAKVVGMAAVMRVAVATKAARNNVHAVGVGRKLVNGKSTSTRCLRLYVVQKLAPSALSQRDRLPNKIDGIPTDVIQSPPAFISVTACSSARGRRQRPLVAGISAAHRAVTAGTISCFCWSTRPDDPDGVVYVLSNNHVFADVNQAAPGDALLQMAASRRTISPTCIGLYEYGWEGCSLTAWTRLSAGCELGFNFAAASAAWGS